MIEVVVTVVALFIAAICAWQLLGGNSTHASSTQQRPPTGKSVRKGKGSKKSNKGNKIDEAEAESEPTGIQTETTKTHVVKRLVNTDVKALKKEEGEDWNLVVHKRTKWEAKKKAVSEEFRHNLRKKMDQRNPYWDKLPSDVTKRTPNDWKLLKYSESGPKQKQRREVKAKDMTEEYRHLLQQMAALSDPGIPQADVSFRLKSKVGLPYHTVQSFFMEQRTTVTSEEEEEEVELVCDAKKVGKLVDIYMQPTSLGAVVGGLFISVDHSAFTNEHCVDELWMATTWFPAIIKLLKGEVAKAYPFWQRADEAACVLLQQSDDGERIILQHQFSNVRATLKETSAQFSAFIEAILREAHLLQQFLVAFNDELDKRRAAKPKDKQTKDMIEGLKKSLPANLDVQLDNLQEANHEFFDRI